MYFSQSFSGMRFLYVFLFCFCCCLNLFSQFSDDFSDGELSDWSGDVSNFIVTAGELQLQGDCVSGGLNTLSIPVSTKDSAVWQFYVRCEFDPSSSNFARIYLQSDQADLLGSLNGYFIQIGGISGSEDAIELYKQTGTDKSLILSGTVGEAAISPELGVKVVRTDVGEWKLYADASGGTDYLFETSAFDTEINGGIYFGMSCTYSSTRCDLFYFDNFLIDPLYTDIDAPEISSVNIIASNTLEILFNETVELLSAEDEGNYSISGAVGNPINASRDITDDKKVTLTFADNFPEDIALILTISGIKDIVGNTSSAFDYTFTYHTIHQYDVLIDEIFADQTPVVALPEAEYIELYNASSIAIDLAGFIISDGSTISSAFSSLLLESGNYLIVSDDANAGLFNSYGDVFYLNGFPSLNNDADQIQLISSTGLIVHDVSYTSAWYQNTLKSEGGYSLEMIDVEYPCQGSANWTASIATEGGTPGTQNSVHANNPDETAPSLLSAFVNALDSLIIYFDEAPESSSIVASNFSVDHAIGIAISAESDLENPLAVHLFFSNPFSENILYTISCSGITDCSGNEILLNNSAEFGIATEPLAGDIVINEILFNPVTDGYDFIELYNRSDKFIDVSKLSLAEFDIDDSSLMSEITQISLQSKLFLPASYLVISQNTLQVSTQYMIASTENFIENNATPNYPDDDGIAAILDESGNIIDKLNYSDSWHFALLDDDDGVSLERLNYQAETQNQNNWHSAAEDKHFGTPGLQNSIFGELAGAENLFHLEYGVFSPDGDGYHDYLILNYDITGLGTISQILIYDAQGRFVKQLANNELLSSNGFLTWDGINEKNEKSKMGNYIAYIEIFDLNGNVQKEKLKFTLIRKSS